MKWKIRQKKRAVKPAVSNGKEEKERNVLF
jgi:hypothetical protein